jgi:hypothetical protein
VGIQDLVAERKGFEPLVGGYPTTVFETAAFDRSATSPTPENKQFFLLMSKEKTDYYRECNGKSLER